MTQAPQSAQGYAGFTGNRKAVFSNGTTYDGEWLNGKPHGRGTLNHVSGSVYEGSYENGLQHGYGKYTQKKPDGSIRQTYEGDFLQDKHSGWGVLTFEGKEKYEGNFFKGRPHGRGTLTFLVSG